MRLAVVESRAGYRIWRSGDYLIKAERQHGGNWTFDVFSADWGVRLTYGVTATMSEAKRRAWEWVGRDSAKEQLQ